MNNDLAHLNDNNDLQHNTSYENELGQLNVNNEKFTQKSNCKYLSDTPFEREYDGLQYKNQSWTSGSERTSMA